MRATRPARYFSSFNHSDHCLNSLIKGNASELQIPSFPILLLDAHTKDIPLTSAPVKAIPMETVTMV